MFNGDGGNSSKATILVGVLMLVLGAGITQFTSVMVTGATTMASVEGLEKKLDETRASLLKASDNVSLLRERVRGLEENIHTLTEVTTGLKDQISELSRELRKNGRG